MEWRLSTEDRSSSSSREVNHRTTMCMDTDMDMWRSRRRRACSPAEDTRACHLDAEWREAWDQEAEAECGSPELWAESEAESAEECQEDDAAEAEAEDGGACQREHQESSEESSERKTWTEERVEGTGCMMGVEEKARVTGWAWAWAWAWAEEEARVCREEAGAIETEAESEAEECRGRASEEWEKEAEWAKEPEAAE